MKQILTVILNHFELQIIIAPNAENDLKALKRSEPAAFEKAQILIRELSLHPKTGTGKPVLKKYNLAGLYSRRITHKHRLVYSVSDSEITVYVISAKGHYSDK